MYRPIRTLGAGGMAKVTLAVDDATGTHVVLKRTLSGMPADERRLRVEGNLGRRLKHTAIVRTLDVYDDDDGSPVVVLEYVPGLSMSALRGAGPVPPGLCAVVGKHVAEALHAIHTAVDEVGRPMHMLHRDVTPANILVDLSGQAKLIDLGIARAAGDNLTLTATGEVRGTLRYLAPELFQGEKQSTSSDLWALGIVILEAAIGQPLHNGNTAEIIARILKQSPLTPNILDRVDPALAGVLTPLLATERAARESDASVVARAFARLAMQSRADERALASHVHSVVDATAAPQVDGAGRAPDDESWSSLLDARAQLASATTRVARGGADATVALLPADNARTQRGGAVIGVAAGVAAAALAAIVAIVVVPGAPVDAPGVAPVTAPLATSAGRSGAAPAAAPSLDPTRLVPSPTAPAARADVLLPYGSTWRYHDRGTDPGARWREPSFSDDAWPSGKAKLGYGGDGEVTLLSYGTDARNKHPAAYFRTTFDVDGARVDERGVLVASMIHDDGAALYLNGVEIVRTGLAPDATHRDYAVQVVQRGRGELKGQVFRLPARALRPGKNVIAAEVHQADGTSSDLAFELQLALEPPRADETRAND